MLLRADTAVAAEQQGGWITVTVRCILVYKTIHVESAWSGLRR